jgi:hypothetical protein
VSVVRRLCYVAAVISVAVQAAGCGSGHRRPEPRWVQQANALCKRDDRTFRGAIFESPAMFMGLRREVTGLRRLGFFRHLPAVAADLEAANRLLIGAGPSGTDFPLLRKADKALIRARNDAARSGVICSFAAFPLANL